MVKFIEIDFYLQRNRFREITKFYIPPILRRAKMENAGEILETYYVITYKLINIFNDIIVLASTQSLDVRETPGTLPFDVRESPGTLPFSDSGSNRPKKSKHFSSYRLVQIDCMYLFIN